MTDSKIVPSKEKLDSLREEVEKLFIQAKKKDAAEYICSIKYFFDMNYLHAKTPSKELADTVSQTLEIIPNIQSNSDYTLKILSYVYCQIFESANWINLIYNLLLIMNGECVSQNPYEKKITKEKIEEALKEIKIHLESHAVNQTKLKNIYGISGGIANLNVSIISKIKKIKDLSQSLNFGIGNIIDKLFVNDFRNDFVHSQFVIYKNTFNLFNKNKSISNESLIDIVVCVLNLYIFIMQFSQEEIEEIVKLGSKEYEGKCGTVKITIDKDQIFHESKMLCGNF